MDDNSSIKNCLIVAREGETLIKLGSGIDNTEFIRLDGYAIVPLEDFDDPAKVADLVRLARETALSAAARRTVSIAHPCPSAPRSRLH